MENNGACSDSFSGGSRWGKAIAGLLAESTAVAAAKAAGIPISTLRKWMRNPRFRQKLSNARDAAVNHAAAVLAEAAVSAASKLRTLIDSDNPQIALSASCGLLDRAGRFSEHVDLRKQIEEISLKLKQIEEKNQEAEK